LGEAGEVGKGRTRRLSTKEGAFDTSVSSFKVYVSDLTYLATARPAGCLMLRLDLKTVEATAV
jgi:hypothetical protein